jgi:hypothetical protein
MDNMYVNPMELSINKDVHIDSDLHVSDVLVASNIEHYNRIRMVGEYVNVMDNMYVNPMELSINKDVHIDSDLHVSDVLVASNIEHYNRIRMAGEYVNVMDNAYIFADTLSINKDVHIDSDTHIRDTLICSNIEFATRIDIRTNELVLNDSIYITPESVMMDADVVQNQLIVNELIQAYEFISFPESNMSFKTSNHLYFECETFNFNNEFLYDSTLPPEEKTRLTFTLCNDLRIFGTLACGSITINAFEEREKTIDLTGSHIDNAQLLPSLIVGENENIREATMVGTGYETVFMKPVYFLHDAYFSSNLKIDPVFNLTIEAKKDLIVHGDVIGTNDGHLDKLKDFTGIPSNNIRVISDMTMEDSSLFWHHEESGALWWSRINPDPIDPHTGDLEFKSINGSGFAMTDNYNPNVLNFTGQHRCTSRIKINEIEDFVGKIVVCTGEYSDLDNIKRVSINEAIPIVALSSKPMDKRVFGVISDEENDSMSRDFHFGYLKFMVKKKRRCRKVVVNSVGEGGIWVSDENGELENGDYITTSSIPGYGMKQHETFVLSSTVAKITCDCDFNLESAIYRCEKDSYKNKHFKKAFVGCTYKC